jgi:hypothetical protein
MLTMGLVTFVNYVPDSLSTSLFGLAVPLFRDGYWPPTLFSFVGLTASWGGIVSFVVLGLLVRWVWRQFSQGRALGFAPIVALVLHLSALRLATRNDASDQAAVGHLKSVWWVGGTGR